MKVTARDDQPSRPAEGERRGPGRPRHEEPSPKYLARQSEIVDLAAEVFRKRGYDGVPLDDIADAVGLRKVSLYYYVDSKGKLLYLVFDRAISLALARLEQISGTPRERLEALVRHQVAMILEDPNLFTVYFDQHYHLEEEYKTEILKKERRYLRICADVVAAAIADGTLPKANQRYATQTVLAVGSWVYKWFDPKRDDPKAIADTAVAMLLGPDRSAPPARRKSRA